MARDYKRSPTQSAQERPAGSWLSFLTGLGIGLVAAIVVYFWTQQPHNRLTSPASGPEAASAPSEEVAAPPVESEHLSLPKFDFYKILPEIEVKVPDEDLTEAQTGESPATSPTEQVEIGTAFILQVASFQNFDDADQSKAQLALQGVQATIQRVVINGQDVWYRVHVGPFPKLTTAQQTRARLAQLGINAIVLKLGGSGN